tara:strand:- start:12122 stop:12733 length:612 start_codon:yes stop_codon:yes gene_type:complete
VKISNSLSKRRIIGITGGIASGKSIISNFLKHEKKLPVLDADEYARDLLSVEQTTTAKVIKRYGESIINSKQNNQTINRKKLRKIIFNDPKEKKWLESIMHPLIKENMSNDCIKLNNSPIIVLIVPLLFEANFTNLCNEIWLIYCPKIMQIERLMKRDQINISEAKNIINAQMQYEAKINSADQIINNSKNNDLWKMQIREIL